jgi:hypothetical protein
MEASMVMRYVAHILLGAA